MCTSAFVLSSSNLCNFTTQSTILYALQYNLTYHTTQPYTPNRTILYNKKHNPIQQTKQSYTTQNTTLYIVQHNSIKNYTISPLITSNNNRRPPPIYHTFTQFYPSSYNLSQPVTPTHPPTHANAIPFIRSYPLHVTNGAPQSAFDPTADM